MNVVVLTTRLFEHPTSGGEVCTARLLRALAAAGHQAVVLGRGPDQVGKTAEVSKRSIGKLVNPFEDLPRWKQGAAIARALATRQALTVSRHMDDNAAGRVADALSRLANASKVDALVVDHLQPFSWFSHVHWPQASPAPLVVMHNLESDSYIERAENADRAGRRWHAAIFRREARLLRRLEDTMLSDAGAVLCLSDTDAHRLEARTRCTAPSSFIGVLPGYPLIGPTTLPVRDGLHRIGMLGTWTWGPNADGLDWMLQRVLPLLPQHCRLVLAGGGLEGRVLPERVISLGRVGAAHQFYEAVDVVAIIAHSGSGVQEKAIEAIGSGRPIVATRHALRGLGPPWPWAIQTADDAETFARLCATQRQGEDTVRGARKWSAHRTSRYAQVLTQALERARNRRQS